MVDIPKDAVTYNDILQWQESVKQLAAIKAKEMLLRKRIFDGIFVNPIEGTMRLRISDNQELVAVNKISRSIDEAVLSSLIRPFHEKGIPVDSLLKYKPELVINEYRKLPDDQRKFFDNALVIKPGSPSMKVETIKAK